MRLTKFVTGCLLFIGWSCSNGNLPYYEIGLENVDTFIDQYADSSYFSEITKMQYDRDHIYALDTRRCDIAVLDTSLYLKYKIGRIGRGPTELTRPVAFYVRQDTTAVLDFGSKRIKCFEKGRFISAKPLPNGCEKHFFFTDFEYYIPAVTEKNVYMVMQRHTKDSIAAHTYHGTLELVRNMGSSLHLNERNLLYHASGCYAVPEALPYVERYDLRDHKLLNRYDLSEIEPFKSNLAYIAAKGQNEKSFYILVTDAYIQDDRLFILCNKLGKYSANTILEIRLLPELHVDRIYKLPGLIYGSFYVSPTHFYAFNARESTIEAIKRPV